MPEKRFVCKVQRIGNTVINPKIEYSFSKGIMETVLHAERMVRLRIDRKDSIEKFANGVRAVKSYIEDTLAPIFLANCFNVTTDYVYSIMAACYEDELFHDVSSFLNKEVIDNYEKQKDSKQYLQVSLVLSVKNDLKDSTQNFFNPGQLSIRRACMGNAKFKISMYLEDNEPQVHNVVVDEFVVV